MARRLRSLLIGGLALALAGCASVGARVDTAASIAQSAGLKHQFVSAEPFVLTAYGRIADPAGPVTIYIEGDGFAWVTRHQVSMDPTPRNPVALRLAVLDPAANVIYLGRPCQYTPREMSPRCQPRYWTSHRFAEEVVASIDRAIDTLRPQASAGVHLVGFSGGGAVAALVAARRQDVLSLRTVAGNLDHEAVNRHHKVSPLVGSLNAVVHARALAGLPQVHLVGGQDTVVPPHIAAGFARAAQDTRCIQIQNVPTARHEAGWEAAWRHHVSEPPTCRPTTR